MAIQAELQKLSRSAIIELFTLEVLDSGDIYRFHAGTNDYRGGIIWAGDTYEAYPIEASGFDVSGQGSLPRPMLRIANTTSIISALLRATDDLLGSKLTRTRTLALYLDATNFSGGNPNADSLQIIDNDVFFIDRKASESREAVELELRSALDLETIQLPRRVIAQNLCPWKYKGENCGYVPGAMFDANDQPVTNAADDKCGKRLSSCRARFGSGIKPFGGFPAAGMTR